MSSFEGAGFPVRRPFPGALDLQHTDPFLMLDQMGPVDYLPGQGRGRARSPAPRVRDRHLPDRRRDGAPRLVRRWRRDPRRRHAVDDRGRRPRALRDADREDDARRRLLARRAALGEPAAPTSAPSRATRTSPATSSRCSATKTATRSCGSSPATSAGVNGPGNTHTPIALAHATLQPGAHLALEWPREFNALVYVLSGSGRVGGDDGQAVRSGQVAALGAGDVVWSSTPIPTPTSRSKCCCSAASRSASRCSPTARS